MEQTISASEFKATCLDILKRLGQHKLAKVTVTRHGKPVAVLIPPELDEQAARAAIGGMKGRAIVSPEVDLTQPVFEGEMDAAKGILHR